MRSSPFAADLLFAGAAGFAHRGLHGPGVPENSMAAFRAAIAADAGIECDVRMSRDGFPMVFHDANLERLCGVPVETSSVHAATLMQLPLAGTRERIPWLGQLLELVSGHVPLLLEIKAQPGLDLLCAAILSELKRYSGPCAVMSFDPRVGAWFARHAPGVRRGVVIGPDEGALERWLKLRLSAAQLLAVETSLVATSWAQGLRRSGLPLATWTVRTQETRERLVNQVDAIIWEGDGRP